MNTIGERLKELRGPTSQQEMAAAVGIKYQAWARYERGDVLPGAEIIQKICRVHACSSDWLLGLDRQQASVIVKGSGNAIANGPYAKASVVTPTQNCKNCPHLKKLKQLEKLLAK